MRVATVLKFQNASAGQQIIFVISLRSHEGETSSVRKWAYKTSLGRTHTRNQCRGAWRNSIFRFVEALLEPWSGSNYMNTDRQKWRSWTVDFQRRNQSAHLPTPAMSIELWRVWIIRWKSNLSLNPHRSIEKHLWLKRELFVVSCRWRDSPPRCHELLWLRCPAFYCIRRFYLVKRFSDTLSYIAWFALYRPSSQPG